jgi:hypothetical protein
MIAEAAEWDVFVCHASEDKDDFVRPLAQGLEAHGLTPMSQIPDPRT